MYHITLTQPAWMILSRKQKRLHVHKMLHAVKVNQDGTHSVKIMN